MVYPVPPRMSRLVVEGLGTKAILDELSAILADRLRMVFEDGVALPSDKRSGREIHSFLAQLESGEDLIPGLDRVTLVRCRPGRNGASLALTFLYPA